MRMDRQLWKILQFSWVYSYNSCMCASCLWRLIEYHTPVCLVGACLKPRRRNSAAFHDFSSRIPRNRRLGRSALYLILSIFFLPLTWNLHVFWFIGAQNFMEPIQIPPEVYGRKITKLWRTVVRGSDQMCSLFSLQCLIWVRRSRDNEQRPPIDKERRADWFWTRSETLVLGVCS